MSETTPAPQPTVQAAAPAPPPAMPVPSSLANQQRLQSSVAKPAAGRNYVVLRKQADEYARSGRCDEAIKLYQELEKSGEYISPTERVNWVRCLTQRGRQEEAQQRLDELKAEKRVTNAQIQDAERELGDSRRKVESKKAKKAPAAASDRAAPTTATTQQRAAEPAPAQASPPDATHTKVDSKGQAY
jgi:pentatricopeptide repeat protein